LGLEAVEEAGQEELQGLLGAGDVGAGVVGEGFEGAMAEGASEVEAVVGIESAEVVTGFGGKAFGPGGFEGEHTGEYGEGRLGRIAAAGEGDRIGGTAKAADRAALTAAAARRWLLRSCLTSKTA